MDLNHFFHFVIGIFGNATDLFLYLAPVITFYRIIKTKSTEEFSGVPYVSALLGCLLSAWYGLPFVSPNNLLLSTIDGTGAVIELVYVIVFLIYAPKEGKAKIFGLFLVVLLVFALVVLVSLLALHGKSKKVFCGLAATIFLISMYASPLSIVVPNGFGCGLGCLQLILYAIYRKNKGGKDEGGSSNAKCSINDDSIELGNLDKTFNNPNINNKQ